MTYWILEHRRNLRRDNDESSDCGWIPCGIFESLDNAKRVADENTPTATWIGNWHEMEWPDKKMIWYRGYEIMQIDNLWRIVPFKLNTFTLVYDRDVRDIEKV